MSVDDDKRYPGARCRECVFCNRNARTCEFHDWHPIPCRPQNFACVEFEPRDEEEGGAL